MSEPGEIDEDMVIVSHVIFQGEGVICEHCKSTRPLPAGIPGFLKDMRRFNAEHEHCDNPNKDQR